MQICENCQKEFESKNVKRRFCSSHCSNVANWKNKNPIIKAFYGIKSIKEIPEDKLKELHFIDLDTISKMLGRHDLFAIRDEYREFRYNTKLCKNCNEFYYSTKRSGSKCPNPKCSSYNSDRWQDGVKKAKEIKLKNHGNPNYNNTEKQKKTMIERYGVPHPFQSAEIMEKMRKTYEEKFGVDHPWKSPEIQAKRKKTSLELYGEEYPAKAAAVKEKQIQTMIERYGVPSSNYIHYTNFENFNPDFILKNFVKDGYLQEEAAREYFSSKGIKPILNCLNAANADYKREPRGCRLQRKFFWDYLKENDVKIIFEKQLGSFRVDGFIAPNIIIEFLGDYWHGRRNDNYVIKQLSRTTKDLYTETFSRFQQLKSQGFQIYYIWESDYKQSGITALQNF